MYEKKSFGKSPQFSVIHAIGRSAMYFYVSFMVYISVEKEVNPQQPVTSYIFQCICSQTSLKSFAQYYTSFCVLHLKAKFVSSVC